MFPSSRLQGLTGHSHTFRELMRSSSAVFQWETRWLLVPFSIDVLSNGVKIVKGCEGNLFSATPAMQGVHVVHNGVFQYLCGGFLDRLRILRKRQCRHSGWPWSWRRSCDMVQRSTMFNDVQRCSTHLEHIACTIFAFDHLFITYVYV